MTNSELSCAFQPVKKSDQQINKKAVQSTDVLTKLIKEFYDIFSEFIYKSINHRVTEGNFLADFKKSEVIHFMKMMEEQIFKLQANEYSFLCFKNTFFFL